MPKTLNTLSKRSFVLALSLAVVILFAAPAWSGQSGHHRKEALYQGRDGYGVPKIQQGWVAQNDRGKKSSQSLSPEEKSRLNGKIRKWKSLPPEEQDALGEWVLREIESEYRWGKLFTRSQDELGVLAEEALAEHRRGETEDLDPSLL